MKAALIGLGRMGLRHLDNLLALKLDVVGVCDPFEQSRTTAKEKAGLSDDRLFADAAEMIAKAKPALLVIATTAPVHAELTILAAESGVKAILCEKPMATSLAAAQQMIEACAKSGTRLAINHQMRFMDQYTIPKTMLESEQFGGVTSIHVSAGNFGLAMNGSHYFEMFRYIAEAAPVEAQAWFSADTVPNPRGPQFEDRAGSVRLVAANGVRFTLDCSSDQGHGCRVSYTARNGQIFVDELGGKMNWTVRQAEHLAMPTTRYGMPWEEGERKIEPADALVPSLRVTEALIKGKNFTTGEEGLLAIRALVAAHVSDAEGHRVVRLDEQLPDDRVFPWA
ncbi:MAG: Gfo/Idh/MocA family oxidoreductase [Verrucomicrobiota bacterium]|nr:Gfo/Idh/MocA family oxidoreductase [Verrucomicrobiota bacterium]